jgi:hypothetical protein
MFDGFRRHPLRSVWDYGLTQHIIREVFGDECNRAGLA